MGEIKFGPARIPSRESPEAAIEGLLERGLSACEIDFETKFWMDYDFASRLGALARGDRATATTYLARGLPSEAFMDSSARILSVRPASAGGEQYKVTADVTTSSGEYYITFMLQPGTGGLQITDHYAIKP